MGAIRFWEGFEVMSDWWCLIRRDWPRASRGGLRARSSLLLSVFRDIHDFVFEDKEVGTILAGEADHVFVVVFDPSAHDFAVGQFQAYGLLLFAECLQIAGFFVSLVWGRRALFAHVWVS